jgi:hypothetical protein
MCFCSKTKEVAARITKVLILLITMFSLSALHGNPDIIPRKIIVALKTNDQVKIDGLLNESIWKDASIGSDFIQFEPVNGKKSSFETEVRVLYDNTALYIGARMFDPYPDSIRTGLGERDDWSMDADIFALSLDPFNDGMSGFEFWISASGVQVDQFLAMNNSNGFNWDAVWESNVSIDNLGWCAEIRIPYSAIRFPNKDVQEWGVIFWRGISRYNEWSTWQHIDPEINGVLQQSGKIEGIQDIKPPARLALFPYVSSYVEKNTDNQWGYSYGGGMDVKYGINESFTMDVTLIPDFSQVQSDDRVLNLSPYEIKYDEKRQFFTEGMDIFNKGGIFYSRRVGSTPKGYDDAEESLKENEIIKANPTENKMVNATKISGRTSKGLGIGFFNAMTTQSEATIEDTLSGITRKFITQPFTNYNVFVFDQSLKNNSYVSFINTNVWQPETRSSANVSGIDYRLVEKSNNYAIGGRLNVSQIYDATGKPDFGQEYLISLQKVSGKFRFDLSRSSISHTYNPNDLGFLMRNNENINKLLLGYYKFKPTWIFLNWYATVEIGHSSMFAPNKFAHLYFWFRTQGLLKNNTRIGTQVIFYPVEKHDFYEAREEGRVFIRPGSYEVAAWAIPDYKKKFGVGVVAAIENSYAYVFPQRIYYLQFMPRYRPNDKFRFGYDLLSHIRGQEIGFVDDLSEYILFGKRDVNTLVNTISSCYIFNNKTSISLRLRHYWSTAIYDEFFMLRDDGYLDKADYAENHDINYNAFNIDLIYTWNFAPGSELSVMWKNMINNDEEPVSLNYLRNLEQTLNYAQTNSISVKLLYYIDYVSIKKLLARNQKAINHKA